MLKGMIRKKSGNDMVGGFEIRKEINKVRERIGLCKKNKVMFEEIKVRENIYLFGKLKGMYGDELNAEIKKYVSLLEMEPKEKYERSNM
jgi:ATP-binding cassette subfamily A (ABC1) protein 3